MRSVLIRQKHLLRLADGTALGAALRLALQGGSGDVLAGMIASLLGQKQLRSEAHDPYGAEVTAWAVFYHGQCGDRCAEKFGEYGMTPSDMLATIPEVLKEHENNI